jgi:hypothetical protein
MFLKAFAAPAFLILSCCSFAAFGQPLSTYVNLQNQVMVWDNGMIRKVDYLQPIEVKVGRSAIPYIDNSRSFKVYYGGSVRTLNQGITNEYNVSDNLVSYLNARSLNVFDHGKTKNLTGICEQYYLGDSVLLFLDGVRREWKLYYNGEVYPIESFLAADAINTTEGSGNAVKVSDNIAAYVNYANQFRIFYQGQIIAQEEYMIQGFDVGRNTVAYLNANREFYVFHKGETIKVEEFAPTRYRAGDDLVAFQSNDGYFKIFYNDSVYRIGFFTPNNLRVVDNIVCYQDPTGYMKVFYKGQIYTLESYFPENLEIKYHSLAYVNRANVLRMFSEGELYDVTTASVERWWLHYDVLQYQIGQNIFRIFYRGVEY